MVAYGDVGESCPEGVVSVPLFENRLHGLDVGYEFRSFVWIML
jgi:hypothetical protein